MNEQQESASWENHAKKIRAELFPVIDLAVHIFVGTAIFILIAAVAVGLDFLIKILEHHNITYIILEGLIIIKVILFFIDVFLFLVFVTLAGWRFINRMYQDIRHEKNNST